MEGGVPRPTDWRASTAAVWQRLCEPLIGIVAADGGDGFQRKGAKGAKMPFGGTQCSTADSAAAEETTDWSKGGWLAIWSGRKD